MTIDVSKTIAPKSDQLNADDLISGARTIKITEVRGLTDVNQPLAMFFEGCEGKPYKPCKSMRRVLVRAWGSEGLDYVGKSLTVYRDESVVFGGVQVGGIRISHMSHIDAPLTLALSESRAKRKPYTVNPIEEVAKVLPELTPTHEKWQGAINALKAKATTVDKIKTGYQLSPENEAKLIEEANKDENN